MSDEPRPRSLTLIALGLVLIALFAALPFIAPPDGHERAALAQFFGRFHPVLVHLPIGLLLLVPLLELLGVLHIWSHLQKTAGLVLALATAGAIAATAAGWLLAWSGGYQGETVMDHLWGGLAFSSACLILIWLRHGYIARDGLVLIRLGYVPMLLFTVGLMAWTAHQGSAITHGEDYLTKFMPAGMRQFFGIAPAPAPTAKPAADTAATATPSLYVAQIAPIFEKHCVSCHKAEKHKADLRMDTYALLMRGGESGAAVVAGSLEKSDLYRRITLHPDDEDFMPTDGKPALKPAEIKLIADWITAGAQP